MIAAAYGAFERQTGGKKLASLHKSSRERLGRNVKRVDGLILLFRG